MTLIPVRARGTFGTVDGSHTHKIELRKTGYSGSVLTLRMGDGGDRVRIEYFGGDENKYDSVKASRISFSIAVQTSTEKALVRDIQESDLFTYAVVWKVDDAIQWRGWVYPEQVSKMVRYNGLVTIQAGDALAILDNCEDLQLATGFWGFAETILQDNSNDRSGLYFNRLFNNQDEILRSNLSWVDIWFSRYYKSYIRSVSHFRSLNNPLDHIEVILKKYALRIFMGPGGVYWIDHIPERQKLESEYKTYSYDTGLSVGTFTELGDEDVTFGETVEKVYSGDSSYRMQPRYSQILFFLTSRAPSDTWAFNAAKALNDGTNAVAVNATYTHNSSTFVVVFVPGYLTEEQQQTLRIAGSVNVVWMRRTSGTNDPLETGTLTKSTGSGPTTIDFSKVDRVDKTIVEDLTEDITNNSFYIKTIEDQDVLSFVPDSAIADPSDITHLRYSGFNGIDPNVFTVGLITEGQEFGTALRRSVFEELDLVTGGTFEIGDHTNWTNNGCTPTTPSGGVMRVTLDATSGVSQDSVYQAITTETSADYVCIIELVNAVPDADGKTRYIQADTATSITWTSGTNLGFAATTEADQEYLLFEFTATGTTTYIHIGQQGGTAGDYSDWSNCKVIKKDFLQKVEELLIDDMKNHYQKPRPLYNLTFRSDAYFNDTFFFGDDVLIPNSMVITPKMKEITGSFINIANDDYIYWDYSSFSGVEDNGEATNSIRKVAAGNQYNSSQQQLLGGYFELSFFTTDDQASPAADTLIEIGFENIATGLATILSLDHSWYLYKNDGTGVRTIYCYEGGVSKYSEVYSFDSTDEFKIRFDGTKMEWLLNDVVKYTSYPSPAFTLDVRIYLNTGSAFGVQKVKLWGEAMQYPYQE